MKKISSQLQKHLQDESEFTLADLYTIRLADGNVMRLTSADVGIEWEGNSYSNDSVVISRESTRVVVGVEVDTNTIAFSPLPDSKLAGLPFVEAATNGALDGATVMIEKAFLSGVDVIGTANLFTGQVADVSTSRNHVEATVKSRLEVLNSPFPRNVYQSGCTRTLHDDGCTVQKATVTVAGRVTAASTTGNTAAVSLIQAAGWFSQGVIEFTTGRNKGMVRTVKDHTKTDTGGTLTFALRLPFPPAVGDSFTIRPGCDKTLATCKAKFNNETRFRGFPFIPSAENVL